MGYDPTGTPGISCARERPRLGKQISEEKRKEMALAKKRDKMIGKIRALYAASGKDEPFGLGMAKMEILQMHLDRAKGVTSAALKERAREGAAANAIKL